MGRPTRLSFCPSQRKQPSMSFYNNPAESNLMATLERPTNQMLVRSELGKSKRSTFDLPTNPDHAYGVPLRRDEEGCGKVISSWQNHEGARCTDLGTNFTAVNKNAINAGATTAADTKTFSTHTAAKSGPLPPFQSS